MKFLNLNDNLYLPIFEKWVHPKYLQNSRMVLSTPCNDDKICGNKLAELFRYKFILKVILSHPIFLTKEPAGFLGKLSSASYQLFLILLNSHLVFCEDRKQTLKVPWVRIVSVIWQYYVLNVLLSTDWKSDWWIFTEKRSFQVLFPTSF